MTAPKPSVHGYRLLQVTVRGYGYLTGGPIVDPADAMPPHVGTHFVTVGAVVRYIRAELRGNSSIWQVRIIAEDNTVLLGFRAGPNGTGETWTWRTPTPTVHNPAEASR